MSNSYVISHNTSMDGVTFDNQEDRIFYGTYFFLSNSRSEHSRRLYTVLDLLAQIGGMYSIFFTIAYLCGHYVNTQMFMHKMMSEMQFVKYSDKYLQSPQCDQQLLDRSTRLTSANLFDLKYNYLDIFSHIKTTCCSIRYGGAKLKKGFLKKSEYLYQKGY